MSSPPYGKYVGQQIQSRERTGSPRGQPAWGGGCVRDSIWIVAKSGLVPNVPIGNLLNRVEPGRYRSRL